MWKTRNLSLTKKQKERGVIFSSILYVNNGTEPVLHEVMQDDPGKEDLIANLKNVSFFRSMAKDLGLDVIEERRG